ncbi:porphobilinogen deaminase 2 [Streptomyces mashuensis]|uniref:Hydroxymethylbilane synthase n=1 Tax=Streptomyces mashuensis TaxID=33904 RepID=A0A919AYV7_9ACTN|nr:hydroxymethylbilane synthase [Streptomyces mashuensis]GHF33265.1 porphobilinogen deaminase 2 [Streptomyces mashuensis]
MSVDVIRIATRSSPMALAQARHVQQLIRDLNPEVKSELMPHTTTADRWKGDLSKLGGKGGFVAGVSALVESGEADIAVHCVKDVPGDVPQIEALTWTAFLPRDDVRDCVLFPEHSDHTSLDTLPKGATVATSAVRRKAQLLRDRPDLKVVPMRGLVHHRINSLDHAVDYDALVLSYAGLARVGLQNRAAQILEPERMLPAVGAGVLGIEARCDRTNVRALVGRLAHARTTAEVTAERAMLAKLRGHCNSPVAGYCTTGSDGQLSLRGMVFSPDGTQFAHAHMWGGAKNEPNQLGVLVFAELMRQGARRIIDSIPH